MHRLDRQFRNGASEFSVKRLRAKPYGPYQVASFEGSAPPLARVAMQQILTIIGYLESLKLAAALAIVRRLATPPCGHRKLVSENTQGSHVQNISGFELQMASAH